MSSYNSKSNFEFFANNVTCFGGKLRLYLKFSKIRYRTCSMKGKSMIKKIPYACMSMWINTVCPANSMLKSWKIAMRK